MLGCIEGPCNLDPLARILKEVPYVTPCVHFIFHVHCPLDSLISTRAWRKLVPVDLLPREKPLWFDSVEPAEMRRAPSNMEQSVVASRIGRTSRMG